jgi:hypothetical protein
MHPPPSLSPSDGKMCGLQVPEKRMPRTTKMRETANHTHVMMVKGWACRHSRKEQSVTNRTPLCQARSKGCSTGAHVLKELYIYFCCARNEAIRVVRAVSAPDRTLGRIGSRLPSPQASPPPPPPPPSGSPSSCLLMKRRISLVILPG